MDNKKVDRYLYGINDIPPWQTLLLMGLQYLIKFSMLLICPIMILNIAGASQQVTQQVISMSLIASGAITIIMALKYKSLDGYFIPIQASVPYFAILLAAAKIGGMPLVFGTTISIGISQFTMIFLLRYMEPILDEPAIGFIILMIGLWASLLGVSELFYTENLGQLIIHEHMLDNTVNTVNSFIGCLTLLIMITLRLLGRHRLYSLLFGMLAGWILASCCGVLLPEKLSLVSHAKWFQLPSLELPHYSFSMHLFLPILLVSFIASLEISALIITINNLVHKEWQNANIRQISRGNFIVSIGTIFSGLIGTVAQSPVPTCVGDFMITGTYSRYIAYVYGPALIFLAFTPKLSMLFLTIPAAVNGAAIVFMGAIMIMKGFSMLHMESLKPHHLQAFGMAFLMGLGTDVVQDALPWFTNSALAVGLFTYLVLRHLFKQGQPNE